MSDSSRSGTRLDVYVLAVSVLGLALIVSVVVGAATVARISFTVPVIVLGALLVLGEMRPIEIARGEEGGDEVTISSTFALALVLTGPVALALAAQTTGVLIEELRSRKPVRRVLFNLAQYGVTLVAARAVFAGLTGTSVLGVTPAFPATSIPAALAAAVAFFVLNHGLVGIAVALDRRVPILAHLRDDVRFQLSTSGVLLTFAPVVVGSMQVTLWLTPLLLLPLFAIHKSASLAAERERQSLHDGLTGLPNRMLLQQRIARLLALPHHAGGLAVMLLDLDHFKEINDTLGHHVGDDLLREVAARLGAVLRDGDTIARLGGDEFAVLASEIAHPSQAVTLAERLVATLHQPMTIDGVRLDVQASIGISIAPEHGTDPETLVQRADVALYTAKETRGCWAMYSPDDDSHTIERLALLGELRVALETGQLLVYYQPKVDARTGVVVGVEALVRWQHPTRGVVPPDEFIPLAENTGVIGELTLQVLRQALAQVRAWREDGLSLGVAVNLSARQLTDLDLPRQVAGLLGSYGLPPEVLTLEVTESTIMADPSRTMTVLRLLAELGVGLSVDDFGTGYSSLSHLRRLSAQELKIDKSFVLNMSANSNDAVIVRSTIELGHNLGLRMVAEGVENAETWRLLRALGCDVVQGYLLSRPLPADRLTAWLREQNLRVDPETPTDPGPARTPTPLPATTNEKSTYQRAGIR